MKKFKFFSIATAALMMLGACSDDKLDGPNGGKNHFTDGKNGVYFAVTIDLPTAGGLGRSMTDQPGNDGSTSNNGVEVGQDQENYVGEIVVVLARKPKNPTTTDPENGFIAAADVSNDITSVDFTKSSYQVLSTLSLTTLDTFYGKLPKNIDNDDFDCNIYVFANPRSPIKNILFGNEEQKITAPVMLTNDWLNKIVTLTEEPTKNIANLQGNSGKGQFLMSNALIATRGIPTNITDWRHYTTEANPFDLSGDNNEIFIDNGTEGRGSVKLQRAAARFDFKDGSPLGNFKYNVVKDAAGNDLIDIELVNMSLVNVNKKFFPLIHVSDKDKDGTLKNSSVCKPELPWKINKDGGYYDGNYVVDADEEWKSSIATAFDSNVDNDNATPSTSVDNILYSDHFYYPLFTKTGEINNIDNAKHWKTDLCANVVKGTNDKNGEYHIWTYATENTIAKAEYQKNGISTGIIFKGRMVAAENALNSEDPTVKELADAINNASRLGEQSPYLFSFAGNIYVDWKGIRNAAINAAVSGITWVPDSDDDPTKGKFEFTSIDRSSSLYVAVFGRGGIGTVEFTYTEYDKVTGKPITGSNGEVIQHTGTLTDEAELDKNSTDYLWGEYQKALKAENAGTTTGQNAINKALADFKKVATNPKGAKITIYQVSDDENDGYGYYCYYYYWNRHNNLGQDGIMNPMEFAVVRNNVYKLAVTSIKQLGHPRLSANDPKRPTGGTDDESQEIYISVTCEVLPWVVRVNDIEF